MGLSAYTATGVWLTAARRLCRLNFRVTGAETLLDRPTLFVSNHFTRAETFLIPYLLYQHTKRQVRTLGMEGLTRGLFGKYFAAVGGMSTKAPRRNRTIIRELMTGEADWLIYPEGGLIKNKKTVHRGRLQLAHPDRGERPPHSGAAMLALKAEIARRRYREACESGDAKRRAYYEETYGLLSPDELADRGVLVVPITATIHPMRSRPNHLLNLATMLARGLGDRMAEELRFEGEALLHSEIGIHFGEPIEAGDILDPATYLARRFAGMFSEKHRNELLLRRQARKLTEVSMRAVYEQTEINLEHLFCAGLRTLKTDRIAVQDFHRRLLIAAYELCTRDDVRVRDSLKTDAARLVTGEPYPALDSIIALATKEGVIERRGETYIINRQRLEEEVPFHEIRIQRMTQVIANELEPNDKAVDVVRRSVNLSTSKLPASTAEALHAEEVRQFDREHDHWFDEDHSPAREAGAPMRLAMHDSPVGVLLVHGYRATPGQMHGLANYLHERDLAVYAPRLAGHGTAPGHLLEVRWREWMHSVERGLALLRQTHDTIIVGGLSIGAVLALMLAARHDDIAGVFSINAPLKIRDFRARLVPALVHSNQAMHRVGLSAGPMESKPRPSSAEIMYQKDYFKGLRECQRAVAACRKRLGEVTAPALIMQSQHDPLVNPHSAVTLMRSLGSEERKLVGLESDLHVPVLEDNPDVESLYEQVHAFITRTTARNVAASGAVGDDQPAAARSAPVRTSRRSVA